MPDESRSQVMEVVGCSIFQHRKRNRTQAARVRTFFLTKHGLRISYLPERGALKDVVFRYYGCCWSARLVSQWECGVHWIPSDRPMKSRYKPMEPCRKIARKPLRRRRV